MANSKKRATKKVRQEPKSAGPQPGSTTSPNVYYNSVDPLLDHRPVEDVANPSAEQAQPHPGRFSPLPQPPIPVSFASSQTSVAAGPRPAPQFVSEANASAGGPASGQLAHGHDIVSLHTLLQSCATTAGSLVPPPHVRTPPADPSGDARGSAPGAIHATFVHTLAPAIPSPSGIVPDASTHHVPPPLGGVPVNLAIPSSVDSPVAASGDIASDATLQAPTGVHEMPLPGSTSVRAQVPGPVAGATAGVTVTDTVPPIPAPPATAVQATDTTATAPRTRSRRERAQPNQVATTAHPPSAASTSTTVSQAVPQQHVRAARIYRHRRTQAQSLPADFVMPRHTPVPDLTWTPPDKCPRAGQGCISCDVYDKEGKVEGPPDLGHKPGRPFACVPCKEVFPDRTAVQQHLKDVHFIHKEGIAAMRTVRFPHHGPRPAGHNGIEDEQDDPVQNLADYKAQHHGAEPDANTHYVHCRVPGCNAIFTRDVTTIGRHTKSRHFRNIRYDCEEPECIETFINLTTLNNHLALHRTRNAQGRPLLAPAPAPAHAPAAPQYEGDTTGQVAQNSSPPAAPVEQMNTSVAISQDPNSQVEHLETSAAAPQDPMPNVHHTQHRSTPVVAPQESELEMGARLVATVVQLAAQHNITVAVSQEPDSDMGARLVAMLVHLAAQDSPSDADGEASVDLASMEPVLAEVLGGNELALKNAGNEMVRPISVKEREGGRAAHESRKGNVDNEGRKDRVESTEKMLQDSAPLTGSRLVNSPLKQGRIVDFTARLAGGPDDETDDDDNENEVAALATPTRPHVVGGAVPSSSKLTITIPARCRAPKASRPSKRHRDEAVSLKAKRVKYDSDSDSDSD